METTGLGKAFAVQIAAVRRDGTVAFNDCVQPLTAIEPAAIAAVVAACPAQGVGGGQCGGEVAGHTREMGESAAGGGGEAALAVGDGLHARAGGRAVPEIAVGLGPVVQRHVLEVGEQAAVDDRGEMGDGVRAVLGAHGGRGR
ncbi:hypothetical protein ACFVJ4_09190 [Streptomyces sp. NPDC127178]|uniref:hypothetical protein n=1 Tax=unclassified Streptomyces TaxID=2593676 RepID=UPI003637F6CB